MSAVLADYGFVTLRLSDDWQGADFIALHTNGESLRVQLKARLTFSKKYEGQDNLYVTFPLDGAWYLYKHNELLESVLAKTSIGQTETWSIKGEYHIGRPGKIYLELLEEYKLEHAGVGGISED